MTRAFTYESTPARILFGAGTLGQAAEEVERLGCHRPLVLSTPQQEEDATRLAATLGGEASVFAGAQMHTTVAATERAMEVCEERGIDCLVSIGGGSTVGLGKAISWRNDAPHIVVATTYAGSEVTDILGQTEEGVKTTVRDPKIRPETVIYDPDLTLGLPVAMSVSSGMNAMAHAVEALYAKDANPVASLMALEGLRALKEALPKIVRTPSDAEARAEALYGSWLCGTVLGAVSMALHHKLCHTLGGTFDLPHAETHAILLPYTAAYNAPSATEQLRPAAELFGGDLSRGLHDLAVELDAPVALKDFGLTEEEIPRAADLAVQNAYWNPREISREGILHLLGQALTGERPTDH